jgi:Flp pilus assembly protein TadD
VDPKNEQAILGRGAALAGLKRYVEAEALLRAQVAATPKNPEAHSGLAQVLDTAGRHQQAIAEYRAAIQLGPQNPYFRGNLGWAQYEAGRLDDAVASSRKAVEIDPKLAYVWFNIGLAYATRDRSEQSRTAYAEGVKAAAVADMRAAINDLKTAQTKGAGKHTVQTEIDFLGASLNKALGLPDDLLMPAAARHPARKAR